MNRFSKFHQHRHNVLLVKMHEKHKHTRKLCCRKDDRAMSPIYGCPEFLGLPDYTHGYYSQHFSWSFVPIDPMNVPTKFEVRSFTRSLDNRGYPKNFESPWICPLSLFSKNFNGLLFGLAL